MPNSIAFCGVDGAGKTTLINKVSNILETKVTHQNGFMKRFYSHQHSRTWEWLNHIELRIRNWHWKRILKSKSLLLDRCYICSLVYANIEGFPSIAHKIRKHAVKPDIIDLLEPVDELVPGAYKFTREYKRVLKEEGYEYFRKGFHLFGRITFWKQPETYVSKILEAHISIIGAP